MADYTKTQLAKIAAPNFNDPSNYAGSLQSAFDAINENFKKIASMPFVQGVQGDSYQLDDKDIFQNGKLTEEGSILLSSILGVHLEPGEFLDGCIEKLKDDELKNAEGGNYFITSVDEDGNETKITPLQCFVTGKAINKIYFYSVFDDEGNKSKSYLGQLYYFIDGRITEIGNVFGNNPQSLKGFYDYTGFYTYVPQNGNTAAHYEKTEVLPTIYYDQERNDICWRLNGEQTGISAMGAKGEDGKDAALVFVRVKYQGSTNPSDPQTQGIVDALFNYGKYNNVMTNEWDTDEEHIKDIKDGIALICIPQSSAVPRTSNYHLKFAFGIVKTESGGDKIAYWNADTILDNFLADQKITDYYTRIGFHSNASSPVALAFSAFPTRLITTGTLTEHSVWSAWNGNENMAQDMVLSRVKASRVHEEDRWSYRRDVKPCGDNQDYGKNVRLDNYDLIVQRFNNEGEITANNAFNELKPKYSKITNDALIVSEGSRSDLPNPSSETGAKFSIIKASDKSIIGGDLEVQGKTVIKGDADVSKKLTVYSGAQISGGATIAGGAKISGGLISNDDTNLRGKVIVTNGGISLKDNVFLDEQKQITCGTGASWHEAQNRAGIINKAYSSDNTFYPIIAGKGKSGYYAAGTLKDSFYLDYIPNTAKTWSDAKQLEINYDHFSRINNAVAGMEDDGGTHIKHRNLRVDRIHAITAQTFGGWAENYGSSDYPLNNNQSASTARLINSNIICIWGHSGGLEKNYYFKMPTDNSFVGFLYIGSHKDDSWATYCTIKVHFLKSDGTETSLAEFSAGTIAGTYQQVFFVPGWSTAVTLR